jgi:hypothetical protein
MDDIRAPLYTEIKKLRLPLIEKGQLPDVGVGLIDLRISVNSP